MDNAALIALPVSEIRGLLTQEAHQEGNPRQDEIEGPSRVLSRDFKEVLSKAFNSFKVFYAEEAREVREREEFLCELEGVPLQIRTSNSSVGFPNLGVWAKFSDLVLNWARHQHLRHSGRDWRVEPLVLDAFRSEVLDALYRACVESEEGDNLEVIGGDLIIEALQLAHFLQANDAVQKLVDVVADNLDCENALSICSLADRLALSGLFERSLSFITARMDRQLESNSFFSDLDPLLQDKIISMRNLIHSSVIGRGYASSVFFSNAAELLAILSESLRDQKERLAEAKLRNDELNGELSESSIADAVAKLASQESRLMTLEAFVDEQKKIFGGILRDGRLRASTV